MKNLPIIIKFLSIMGAFGLFALGVAFYATSQMRAIDNGYTALMAGNAQATLLISRANRSFQSARVGIAEVTIANTQALDQVANTLETSSRQGFINYMDKAAQIAPAHAADISALKASGLDVLDNACGPALSMGAAATTDAADIAAQQEYLNDCSPKFPAVSDALLNETDAISTETNQADDQLTATTDSTIMLTYAGILGGLAVVLAAGFFAIRNWVVSPVKQLETIMGRLAGGDMKANVTGLERRDEIGGMARAVQVFKDAGIEKIRLESEAKAMAARAEAERETAEAERAEAAKQQELVVTSVAQGLDRLSHGDLLFRLNTSFASEYEKLRHDFNAAMDNLQATMVSIATNTQGVRSGAGEITQASDDLARRTEQQAASLEQTAAALDEITATVRKTAEGATEARDVVSTAKNDAERSGAVVRETVEAMSGIEESSKKIGNIIGVIDEIAFQTNLLALNAGVEAARAGDAGRGFAVVATEVRALAQRSADAAKEIKALISESGGQVESGVRLVGQTGKALERIVEQVNRLNVLVTDIAGSAQEQATGLAEVNTAVNQMDQVTQQNAAMVEEATAASHSLAGEAEELARLVGQFEVGTAAAPAHAPAAKHAAKAKQPAPLPATRVPARPRPGAPGHAPAGKFTPIARPEKAGAGAENWDEF